LKKKKNTERLFVKEKDRAFKIRVQCPVVHRLKWSNLEDAPRDEIVAIDRVSLSLLSKRSMCCRKK